MRVVLVTSSWPLPRPGRHVGIERLARGLVDGLAARGVEVRVVTTFWNGGGPEDRYGSVPITRVPDSSAFVGRFASIGDSNYWSWGLSVARVLSRGPPPPVVHMLSPISTTSRIAKRGSAVVSTFYHADEMWRVRDLLHQPLHRILESHAFFASTLVMTPSEASAQAATKRFRLPRERIRPVALGVDPKWFRSRPSRGSEVVRLLFVGPHEPRKGLRYLLEAVAILRRKEQRVHLTTVGKGPDIPSLRLMAQSLGIADAVDFLGYVDDPADVELPRLYAAADIFVLPSLREGFGFVLLEAMASGLPIVASNISAIPEVVGDAGILVAPQDAGALAEGLARLIGDPEEREEIGRRGRQRVEERYTWDKTIDKVLSVYEEAIDLAAKR